jgi:hypothetical protein
MNMATLPSWLDRMANGGEDARAPVKCGRSGESAFQVRALPNEDVCLWIKTIDNSRVSRHADPKLRTAAWRLIGIASAVSVLVVGLLLPAAYKMLAGYHLGRLENEHRELLLERRQLELDASVLRSQENLERLAKVHQMKPAPGKVHYLAVDGEALALNQPKR